MSKDPSYLARDPLPVSRITSYNVCYTKLLRELMTVLKTRFGVSDIPIYELPPAIVVHGGPRTMGVGFFTEA